MVWDWKLAIPSLSKGNTDSAVILFQKKYINWNEGYSVKSQSEEKLIYEHKKNREIEIEK